MLYADSSNVGTCSELHYCFRSDCPVSPHTQHYPVLTSEDDLLQSLGASRFKWHIRRKRVVRAFVLRRKVMGHVKIILFYCCASHSVLQCCCYAIFLLYLYTACPTRYGTRHFFNNCNTSEDIATKFEQEYVRCVRNEEECVCSPLQISLH